MPDWSAMMDLFASDLIYHKKPYLIAFSDGG